MKSLIALLVATTQVTPSPPPVCFTTPELRALAGIAIGPMLTGLAGRCAAYPDAAPALTAAKDGLATRFRAEATAAAPVVGGKLAQAMHLPAADAGATADAFGPVLRLVVSQLTGKFGAKECQSADIVSAAILPLSNAEVVGLFSAILQVAARDPKQSFRACDLNAR